MNVEQEYQRWLSSPLVDEGTKEALRKMTQTEKNDSFFTDLAFGTGGMRGILGPGCNRMNVYTVQKVAYAYGLALLDQYGEEAKKRGIVIAHDNRYCAEEFTKISADTFNKLGIDAYVFASLRPTPELSFAVRKLHCVGGVMITASHNPKEYNGYKIYDEKGCQMVPSVVEPVLAKLSALPNPVELVVPCAEKMGKTHSIGEEIDAPYCSLVEEAQENPDLDKSHFTIVYSPQHGASYESAMRVFASCGYHVIPVAEQCIHDPAFGATKSPNPEKAPAWELILNYASANHADLAVMTDPDGDRCGLAYLSSKGTYERLTGNESAALLIDYILSSKKKKGTMPKDPVLYDTIVTSSLGADIARSYGVKVESFLTGFKYIGDRIGYYEDLGEGPTFVFGYEESYGCLLSPFVRDKDGVQAILLYSEMALSYKLRGIPLDVAFDALQAKYGYHQCAAKEIYFEGMEGAKTMDALMKKCHEEHVDSIDGIKVIETQDYLHDVAAKADGSSRRIEGLPSSDVLKYILEDGSTLAVRPSGTEPKVKFYVEAVSKSPVGLKEKVEEIYSSVRAILGI